MKLEKVYQVEFVYYMNALLKNSVSTDDGEVLHIGSEPFLVKESDLPEYKKYGDGYRSITLVGAMLV